MKSIGGYFELELDKRKNPIHSNALKLNTARNALEYILIVKNYKKVYIPYYTCDVIIEPFNKLNIEYEFYHVDLNFEPKFNFELIGEKEGFLYTNYFGLKDKYISTLFNKCKNLIIDNAQSLFSKPLEDVDTYYSPRKFVGIPDGAFLYSKKKMDSELEMDVSYSRFSHLLKRIDLSAEDGYSDFIESDNSLIGQPIKRMSMLTRALLNSIDFELIALKRRRNFEFFESNLKHLNKLDFNLTDSSVPLVYPFLGEDNTLRERLKENKIYTATYWPIVDKWAPKNLEHLMKNEIVHLPIDQRYDESNLQRILKFVIKN